MGARIVHFGSDDCSRLVVLQRAGYAVDACGTSIPKLQEVLRQNAIDAVAVSEERRQRLEEAVAVSRSISPAPLILFEEVRGTPDVSRFDLVIPPFTPPADWLRSIAQLIERNRAIVEQFKSTRDQSAALRDESASLRMKSADERGRSLRQRAKVEGILKKLPEDPPESE